MICTRFSMLRYIVLSVMGILTGIAVAEFSCRVFAPQYIGYGDYIDDFYVPYRGLGYTSFGPT